MTLKRFAPVILACASCAIGQQICPIQVQKFAYQQPLVMLSYKNTDQKPISVAIFDVAAYNAVGDKLEYEPDAHRRWVNPAHPHALEFTLDSGKDLVKPGKSAQMPLNDSDEFFMGATYDVWVYGVRFADGSTWKDDGSHSCHARFTF